MYKNKQNVNEDCLSIKGRPVRPPVSRIQRHALTIAFSFASVGPPLGPRLCLPLQVSHPIRQLLSPPSLVCQPKSALLSAKIGQPLDPPPLSQPLKVRFPSFAILGSAPLVYRPPPLYVNRSGRDLDLWSLTPKSFSAIPSHMINICGNWNLS